MTVMIYDRVIRVLRCHGEVDKVLLGCYDRVIKVLCHDGLIMVRLLRLSYDRVIRVHLVL